MYCEERREAKKISTHVIYNVSTKALDKFMVVRRRDGGNLVPRKVSELNCVLTHRR